MGRSGAAAALTAVTGGRRGSARRPAVTLTGPESTGKSTLAAALAEHYGAELSPEAARAYAEARRQALPPDTPPDVLLGPGDVEPIARAQLALERAAEARAAASGAALVLRDTDLVSTVVYARHYYGACPAWVEAAARERRADLYLLCDVDLPWVADGPRDRPHARDEMLHEFARTLDELGCRWAPVRGSGPAREAAARRTLETFVVQTGESQEQLHGPRGLGLAGDGPSRPTFDPRDAGIPRNCS